MSPIPSLRTDWSSYIAMLLSVIGLVWLLSSLFEKTKQQNGQTLEERIHALTGSLNDSAALISSIEQEISQRQQLVAKLQQDAAEAEKLKALSADQVAAVAQALRGQLQSENRSAFWPSTFTNLFFAFLGAAIGEGFRWIRLWRQPAADA
jgi:hypothetical protein